MGSDREGRAGKDLVIQVPVGTLLFDSETNELLCDLKKDGDRVEIELPMPVRLQSGHQ